MEFIYQFTTRPPGVKGAGRTPERTRRIHILN